MCIRKVVMDKSSVMEQDKFLDEFIPSVDMRNCIRKTGREFTDFEKAALIYHLKRPWEEKRTALYTIMCQTKDRSLKRQLSERIAYDEKCIALYKENAAGYVYVLKSVEKRDFSVCGYFADPDTAYKWGLEEELPFWIEKHRLVGREDTESGSFASMFLFDEKGRLWTFDSMESDQEDPGICGGFEEVYVQLPNPFERGDFARILERDADERDMDNRDVGIVATSQEQWKRLLPENCDWSEECIMVNFTDKHVGFVHSHLEPIFLEKCELPEGEQGEKLLELKEIMLREEWGEYKAFPE